MGASPDNEIFAMGGMNSDSRSRTQLAWSNINSDTMRPAKTTEAAEAIPNLPHVDGRYAKFGDHIDDFVAGFEDYARFLLSQSRDANQGGLFDGFAGLAVRKVIRPTRFYYMLLQRLQRSPQHGRRRHLVRAGRLPGQAGGLGESRPIHSGRCSAPNARRCWR